MIRTRSLPSGNGRSSFFIDMVANVENFYFIIIIVILWSFQMVWFFHVTLCYSNENGGIIKLCEKHNGHSKRIILFSVWILQWNHQVDKVKILVYSNGICAVRWICVCQPSNYEQAILCHTMKVKRFLPTYRSTFRFLRIWLEFSPIVFRSRERERERIEEKFKVKRFLPPNVCTHLQILRVVPKKKKLFFLLCVNAFICEYIMRKILS